MKRVKCGEELIELVLGEGIILHEWGLDICVTLVVFHRLHLCLVVDVVGGREAKIGGENHRSLLIRVALTHLVVKSW